MKNKGEYPTGQGLPILSQRFNFPIDSDILHFLSLPVLDQLRNAYRRDRDPDRNLSSEMKLRAVWSALNMSSEEREKLGIRLIARVPLDTQGELIVSEPLTYLVYAIFPFLDGIRYITTSRLNLGDALRGELKLQKERHTKVDRVVTCNAELRPETPLDRYNRLIQEIKMSDSLIREQKEVAERIRGRHRVEQDADLAKVISYTDRMSKLNKDKWRLILLYLQAGQSLRGMYPGLPNLFGLRRKGNSRDHLVLEMWHLRESILLRRLLDSSFVLPTVTKSTLLTTNINTRELNTGEANYRNGNASEPDEVVHQTLEIFKQEGFLQ